MEEFDELFYRDPYAREFDAEVISCNPGKKGYEIILSDTAFYPEGGGQPGDTGMLENAKVLDTQRIHGEVVHIAGQPLNPGQAVHGIIDWNRRFDLMQQHSGEHIVSGLVHQHYGYENVGFHMGEDVITIDFSGVLDFSQLEEIEQEANDIVYRNVPIQISYPSREELKTLSYRSKKELTGKVRIVTIPGADVCACCGTHVAQTGEIGLIKILSCIKHKGGVRVEMLSGLRALKETELIQNENTKISHLLSAKPHETASAVERMQNELNDAFQKIYALTMQTLKAQMKDVKEGQKTAVLTGEDIDMNEMRKCCNQLISEKHVTIAAGLSHKGDAWNYVLISPSINLQNKIKELNHALNGRGGGKMDAVQGSFKASLEEIREQLNTL